MMIVTNTSRLTGVKHDRMIEVDPVKFRAWATTPPNKRKMVQDIFPELSPEDREFIISGIIPEEWDAVFCADNNDNENTQTRQAND